MLRKHHHVNKLFNLTLSLETFENGLHATALQLVHEVHIKSFFFKVFIIQGRQNVTDLDEQVHVVGTSGQNLPPPTPHPDYR